MGNGSWEKKYIEQEEVQTEALNTVLEAVENFKRNGYKDVLDLGCGIGRNTIYLAQKGFNVWACDSSDTGLGITKAKAEAMGYMDITYDVENMFNLSYDNESFDAIISIWVQGYGTRREVQLGIDEIFRVLRDNGTVVADFVTVEDSTYGIGEEIEKNTFIGGKSCKEGIPHYYTSQNELEKMFGMFSTVDIYDRTYTFKDESGNDHEVEAVVVRARK